MQFIYLLLLHIFGTGANISKEKDNNQNIVQSSLLLGTLFTFIIYGFIFVNVNHYLSFMGYNVETYKIFTSYSIIQLGLSTIFYILIELLYFENKEDLASKYCLIFNTLNFITLIITAIITKSQLITVIFTLITMGLYILIIYIKLFKKFKLQLNILNNLKYESSTICSDLLFFLIFLFGLKNANKFGIEYISAINFIALITDTQWDALSAVTTVAKIDIAKGEFNYKKHILEGYMLTGLLLTTSIIMMIFLHKLYNLDLLLVLKYFFFELINFCLWAKYATDNILIQLNNSPLKATLVKLITNTVRFIISLLPTPFCTAIGQVVSSIIQFISFDRLKKKYIKK